MTNYCLGLVIARVRAYNDSGIIIVMQVHRECMNEMSYFQTTRIVVLDPTMRERAVLRGSFTILDPNMREGEEVCGVTLTNTGSAQTGSNVEITFKGTGATTNFLCRLDATGDRLPCKSVRVVVLWLNVSIRMCTLTTCNVKTP